MADSAIADSGDAAPAAVDAPPNIQTEIEALSEAQAKTVKPVDLIDPVNKDLLGSPGDAV